MDARPGTKIMKALYRLHTAALAVVFLFAALSCKQTERRSKSITELDAVSRVKYANGFDIIRDGSETRLIIKSPYPDAEEEQSFLLVSRGETGSSGENRVEIPLKRVIVTSTTHIPMLEFLGAADRLVGFPNTDFIVSEATRSRVDEGKVTDVGRDLSLNTEMVIGLQPDAVITFSIDGTDKALSTIGKNGIPILFNGDWLEDRPLGRAEWIKFFGVLLDEEEKADSIFNGIESSYLKAKQIASLAENRPTVLSGVLYKDQWNLPAGDSFAAQLFSDANTDYLWSDSSGQGSLVLNFESVFEKARGADYWIGAGTYTNRNDLLEANGHYTDFEAFSKETIYTFSKRKGAKGGIVYFELGPLQPHIVLMDLIKTTHPELLPGYQPFFLEKLD